MTSPDWSDRDSWSKEIRRRSFGWRSPAVLPLLATAGWVGAYPAVIWYSLTYATNAFLQVAVILLSSEGFASTAITLASHGSGSGATCVAKSRELIAEVAQGDGGMLSSLLSVAATWGPSIQNNSYRLFWPSPKAKDVLDGYCQALANAYKKLRL